MGEIAERLRNSKTANFDHLLEIADDVEILEDQAASQHLVVSAEEFNRVLDELERPAESWVATTKEFWQDQRNKDRLEVKEAVEEWFSDVDLTDLFAVKGWS